MSIHISGRLCLMPDEIKKIRESIVKNGGASSLVKMKPQELVDFFFKQTNNMELSIIMSKQFSMAIISKNRSAVKNWANKWLKGEQKDKVINPKTKELREEYNKILEESKDRIDTEKAFEKLVSNMEGLEINEEDISFVKERVDILQEELLKDSNSLSGLTEEYLKAKSELNDFLHNIKQQSKSDFFIKTWSRAIMLSAPSSFLISNAFFNVFSSASRIFERRVRNNWSDTKASMKGSVMADLRLEYVKEANRIWNKYGIDISRINHSSTISKVLAQGEVIEGSKDYGFLGRISKRIFHNLMGSGDNAFSSFGRVDSDIVNSRILADNWFSGKNIIPSKEEYNEKVKEYTKRLLSLNKNKSLEGLEDKEMELVDFYKAEGVEDAMSLTGQKDTKITKYFLKVRKGMDNIKLFGVNIPLGTMTVPYLATPLNFKVMSVLEYSPIGLLRPVLGSAFSEGKFSDNLLRDNENFKLLKKGSIGTVVFLLYLLAKLDDDDDDYNYAEPYELSSQAQREFVGKYNAVKVFNTFVSIDYLGIFGSSIKSIATVSGKYDKSEWYKVLLANMSDIPFISEIIGAVNYSNEKSQYGITKNGMIADGLNFTLPKLLPMTLIKQMSNFTDSDARRNDYSTWWGQIAGYFPYFREMLPERYNVKGETKKEEPITKFFFGARVGEDLSSDPVVKKILELDKETGGRLGVSLLGIKEYKNLLSMYDEELISHDDLINVFTGTDLAFKVALADYVNGNFDGETDPDKKKSHIESLRKSIMADQIEQHGLGQRYDMYLEDNKKKK